MTIAIAISVFLGLVAAVALLSCVNSMRYGLVRWREVRGELVAIDLVAMDLAAMDRAVSPRLHPLRRPREAFDLLAA